MTRKIFFSLFRQQITPVTLKQMNRSISDPLLDLSKKINFYGNLLILIIGNVSNIVKILFFLQPPLRSNSCSYYILAGTIADLFFLNNQPLIRLLRQLNLVRPMSSLECPIRSYFQTLSFSLSFTFLILAAVDRYCFTSRDYSRRKLSNPRTGLRLIVFVTIAWILINTHHLFHHKLHHGMCTTRFAPGYLHTLMISFFCIVPILLLTFNILTLLNIRSRHHRLQLTVNIQLTFLILFETALTTISILPQTIFLIYFKVTHSTARTATRRSIEQFLDGILKIVAYSECSVGFVIYLIALPKLRQKFFRKFSLCNEPRIIKSQRL